METIIFREETDKTTVIPASPTLPLRGVVFALSVLTMLLTVRYIVWRFSVNQWHLWWLSLPLLAAEIFTALHVLGYQYTVWPRRHRELQLTDDCSTLPVVIFIPTVNEGDDILGPTIDGAVNTRSHFLCRYPQASVRIVVCNDAYVANVSNWKSVEKLAASKGVECVTRKVHGGAKAGNIENARRSVNASGRCIIAVLDADQIPEPDFLVRTIEPFADPTVGWVQTRQFYRNDDVQVSRWAESQAALFYDHVSPAKSLVNSSYICGTNVAIRAEVLDQIGGFPTESVTEDFAASIRTHHRWRSVYLKDTLAKGLGPLDLTGYFLQQSRWARGTIGVLRSDWYRILLPSKNGLTGDQRLQYFLSATHYLCGLRDFIFLSTAAVSLYLSASPIRQVSIETIGLYLIPYIVASQAMLLIQSGTTSVLNGMVIGYISFPTLVLSFFEAAFNRKMRFRVTPKSASGQSDLKAIIPHILVVTICLIVLIHAVSTRAAFTTRDLIPLLWVTYAVCLLTTSFFLAKLKR